MNKLIFLTFAYKILQTVKAFISFLSLDIFKTTKPDFEQKVT